jgi:predicted ribosome quality control (RQC) complex YloA/Tae2 family protein
MTLTRDDLRSVLAELVPVLGDAVVQQVRVPDRDSVVLALRQPGHTHWLLVCTARGLGRVHVVDRAPPNPKESLPFQGLLRKELHGRLVSIEALQGERIVRLVVQGSDQRRALIVELYGGGGNIVLVDEEDRVLGRGGSPRRPGCDAGRGDRWTPPDGDPVWDRMTAAVGLSRNLEFAAHYEAETSRLAASSRVEEASRRLARRRRELARRVARQEADLARAGSPEGLRRRADLLQGSFHLLRRGASSVAVIDWSQEGQPEVHLTVDPSLDPAELVARAFARASKAERALQEGETRLAEGRRELAQMDELIELLALDPGLADQVLGEIQTAPTSSGPRRGQEKRSPFLAFRTPWGQELRAGRSARDNDELTLRRSRGNDVWLHVRGRPGTHVVIREPGPSPPLELLMLAAQLALVRSGIADGAREEVAWTRVKYVTKPKGSKPGSVVARQDQVLYVEVDRSALSALTRIED